VSAGSGLKTAIPKTEFVLRPAARLTKDQFRSVLALQGLLTRLESLAQAGEEQPDLAEHLRLIGEEDVVIRPG